MAANTQIWGSFKNTPSKNFNAQDANDVKMLPTTSKKSIFTTDRTLVEISGPM